MEIISKAYHAWFRFRELGALLIYASLTIQQFTALQHNIATSPSVIDSSSLPSRNHVRKGTDIILNEAN